MTVVTGLFGQALCPSGWGGASGWLQLLSAAAYSLGHGGNDAQKTMGIIVTALVATQHLAGERAARCRCRSGWCCACSTRPWGSGRRWAAGGILVRTMGTRITKLTPADGLLRRGQRGDGAVHRHFCSASPFSTTHTIAGASRARGSCAGSAGSLRLVAKSIAWGLGPHHARRRFLISAGAYLALRALGADVPSGVAAHSLSDTVAAESPRALSARQGWRCWLRAPRLERLRRPVRKTTPG